MKNLVLVLGLTVALVGCARKDSLEIPTGSEVTVQKRDGVTVAGRLVEVKPEQVVVETRDGARIRVPRSEITSLRSQSVEPAKADSAPAVVATTGADADKDKDKDKARNPVAKLFDRKPEYRELTVPAGTVLSLALTTPVASDTSNVEDSVRATLRSGLSVDGVQVVPAGTAVLGHVTSAERAAKVKGRASIAFRFNQIDLPDGERQSISTSTVSRLAPATKKKDATKIGVGAGAGAVVGGILGGGDGAAKGAAIGGGAGTAVVLSTRGDEVRIAAGTPVSVKLTAPLTVKVALK
jgi:outer membrane lipoprotein SlyB